MKLFKDMTFIEQLHELKSTLQEVMQAENSKLKMDLWVSTSPEKPKHFCNSVCCILGYQAIKEADSLNQIEHYAACLSDDLEKDNNPVTRRLAQSIYFSSANYRKNRAKRTMLFSEDELDSINHLNLSEPSFQDAIDYLDICIEKVNSYLA